MKQFIITVCTLAATLSPIYAQQYEFVHLDSRTPQRLNEDNTIISGDSDLIKTLEDEYRCPRNARIRKTTRSETIYKDVTLSQPGTLASMLGDDINEIDSLVVRGPINAADIHTIWRSSFYGDLTVANLEYALIDGNKLLKNAFWHQSEQYTPGSGYINCILLRRIILPDGLEEIGQGAFAYAINLKEINFPSSLRNIKRMCFSDCISLNVNPLVIPEGVEEIGQNAFVNCKALTGKVILPTTLKRINDGVFSSCKITECNFPEGLEEIGDGAFYATRLKEAIIPNTCQSFTGSHHFALCYELEKVSFPEGPTLIPASFVNACINLTEFIMPNSIEEIGLSAFIECRALQELHLSSNLKSINRYGLQSCTGLKTICFPSTLETLRVKCCENWKNVESIYCGAQIPPTCIVSDMDPGWTPFGICGGDFTNGTRQNIPIYVPTGSADLYRNAWGWSYFTNFIETDDFPSAGIHDAVIVDKSKDNSIYDLFGRKVETPVPGTIYIRDGQKFLMK